MSSNTKYDVTALGNAIVDILAYTDEEFLNENNLPKGGMTLIDETQAKALYEKMGTATECSGGSAGNTIVGLASLGAKTAYIGRISDDQFGDIFTHDIKNAGVDFEPIRATDGKPTARCLVFVTSEDDSKLEHSNAERTMATYLGSCTEMTANDVNEDLIKDSKVTYIEGYLWDQEPAKEACMKAINLAHENGRKIAFTLSDMFCVERHKDDFLNLVQNHIDILFANEKESQALFDETDVEKVLQKMHESCDVGIVTMSEKGSKTIGPDGKIHTCEAEKVEKVYDVTGAGDLYAAGFLYGYVNDMDLGKCARLGSLSAAEVIKYLGGRPLTDLDELVRAVS